MQLNKLITGAAIVIAAAMFATPASAQGKGKDQTCPSDAPWTKIDDASGTVVVQVPENSGHFVTISWGGALDSAESEICVFNLPTCWVLQVCIKSGGGKGNQEGKRVFETLTEDGCVGSGSGQAISHISYQFVEIEDCTGTGDECLWCSPGYWRNHLDNWPEGYAPEDIDEVTGVSYLTILCNPRIYARTGDYNRVGDILSAAALGADVCLDEGREENHTCPLGGTSADPACN